VAELEDRKRFAELLYDGISELRQHPYYKTKRKSRALPLGNTLSETYIDKIAIQLRVSTNTIKSWMGQMGEKYVPSRIEDSKLFGLLWLIIEKSDMDARWFAELLQTTSIPIIQPPLPIWISSCFKKARISQDEKFSSPSDEAIKQVMQRLFAADMPVSSSSPIDRMAIHNLPTRWSDVFIGRKHDLQAILQWLNSSLPICLIKGLGGMGKTTISLEVAYACIGDPRGEAASPDFSWPKPKCLIWVSAELKNLTFVDFLDTIAYQLGSAELLDKSLNEKRFVVRQALAAYSEASPVLLIVDSIDTVDREIHEFLVHLPQGVKTLLTAREDQNQIDMFVLREIYSVHLQGLQHSEALEYVSQEVGHQIRIHSKPEKKVKLERFLTEDRDALIKLIDATAGNPKAIALCVAYIADNEIPINQLISEIQEAAFSLGALFDYLFGRACKRCSEDARLLWQVLPYYGKSPTGESWAASAGLDTRRFYIALEQLRGFCLVESERVNGELCYRAHQTVLAYGEHHLPRDKSLETEARLRWSGYYIELLDTYVKRDSPSEDYWNFLLGRNLDIVKQEWPNIHKVLQWVSDHHQSELLIELALRLTHFLSRINLQLRIEYGHKAADAANQLERHDLEALFRIDSIGWALIETGDFKEGARQIELGLSILDQLEPDHATFPNLSVLGRAFLAKSYLKLNDTVKAAAMLDEISSVKCMPVIKHRVMLVQGDYFLHIGELDEAVCYYEKANELSTYYGGEKTIEAYYYLGIAYIRLGEAAKADANLEQILYHKLNPNQIELIYYNYGKAQLCNLQGEREAALQFAQQALALINSWERTFWLRSEVERFYELLFLSESPMTISQDR
jgi:LuxR family glucitol operon transcriptional activator